MTGCVIPGTGIAVDFWHVNKYDDIRYFFLTHLHGDHVVGLTSTWRRPIYCSPITAQLLTYRYGLHGTLLRPLEEGQSHLVYCDRQCERLTDDAKTMTVTVIGANHCPGAVMFLFEGSFGKILHTGDFRFHPSMVDADSLLYPHIDSIDRVYLDNTYCRPGCVFPTREEALGEIVRIARENRDCDILLGIRKLGKEELFAKLGLALREWVCVSPETLLVARALGLPNVFKTAEPDLRVRVVPFRSVTRKYMMDVNQKKRTIAILPTGLCKSIFTNLRYVFAVPYSDHSSYTELKEFVSRLRPASVVPIVRGKRYLDVLDTSCFKPYLSTPIAISSVSAMQQIHNPSSTVLSDSSISHSVYSLFPDSSQGKSGFIPLVHVSTGTANRRSKTNTVTRSKLHAKRTVLKGVHYLSDNEDS